jgi:MtrB/PioB family decaheme-associated outer membrane protein
MAFAADVTVTKAPPAPDTSWETHGIVEFGLLGYIQRPPSVPSAADPSRSNIAGFERFGRVNNGPFLDYLYFGAGSRDGRYNVDLYAQNVGYNNQSYSLDLQKAGEHYLTLGWDQTPFLYGIGSSIWAAGGNALVTAVKFPTSPTTVPQETAINNTVLAAPQIRIGTRRDTASVAYRYTPTPEWDFRADYAHQDRTGTLPQWGIIGTAFGSPAVQMPRPVSDTTQTVNASGEYYGYTFFNTKYNVKVGYGGSFYQDDFSLFTWQNPFGNGTCTGSATCFPAFGFLSTPPNNEAQTVTVTSGVDLPFKSRYMGTVSYTMMRQNDAFGPETISPVVFNTASGKVVPSSTIPALPAASLNGAINTFLSNNVLYTQITPDLKSTLKYRYYDYDNETPVLFFPDYVLADVTLKNTPPDLPRQNLVVSYIKQNASENLTWHPARWWSVGGEVGWERWDRTHMDVNVTNEVYGKVYTDAHLADVAVAHGSLQFAERRYETYDFLDYVAHFTYLSPTETVNSSLMRMFDMANRDRTQGKLWIDFFGPAGITVTPNLGVRLDDYGFDPVIGRFGVKQDNSGYAGLDFAMAVNRTFTLLASYTHEEHNEQMVGANASQINGTGVNTVTTAFNASMLDQVDTVSAAVNIVVIPDTLDFKVSGTYAHDREHWDTAIVQGATPAASSFAPFPDVTNDYTRVDAVVRYRVDPDLVRKLGWWGDVIAKLRYTWERNAVSNWQDLNQPDVFFVDNSATRMISLVAQNPNYNAQVIAASVAVKW